MTVPTELQGEVFVCRAPVSLSSLQRLRSVREVVKRFMVTSLIAKGKDQGFLLSDDIIALFPNAEENVDGLAEFYSSLVAEGIDVVDQAPAKSPLKVKEMPAIER